MMPKMNGFDVCKNIRRAKLAIPVLMLTAKGTIDDKTVGFDCGADDYLVKPFDVQEVLLRIRVLLRRNQPQVEQNLSNEILTAGNIEIFPDTLECVIVNKKIKLTPTEFEILYCLMQHFNNAVTLATLLDEVWGYDSDEDVRMLRVHVGGLRNKIEPDSKNPKYLHTVTNVGYKLTPFGE
jgi:DNA-binding response OmpR family regulator